MAIGDYYQHNNDYFMLKQSFMLNNYNTLFRHSVVTFKQWEATVHLTNIQELLSSAIRYCNSTVFTTSLIFVITYTYI
jgi:hypothetical protein